MILNILLSIFCLITSPVEEADDRKVTVAAASNTQFVMQALIEAYEAKTDVEVELVLGSSGKLAAQISHGAPYDIFLSADMKYPAFLEVKGVTSSEPRIYAKGLAVIWTMKNISVNSMEILAESSIQKIAIANPRTAPYGTLADSILRSNRIYDSVEDKLVFGTNVAQVNQYVMLSAVDVGITSKSVVVSPEIEGKGTWVEIPDATIDQGMVVLKHGSEKNEENTMSFYTFLQSEEAKALFLAYGYQIDME